MPLQTDQQLPAALRQPRGGFRVHTGQKAADDFAEEHAEPDAFAGLAACRLHAFTPVPAARQGQTVLAQPHMVDGPETVLP